MRTWGLGLVVVMLGCGPGERVTGEDAAVLPPCAPFDLTLPATGNVGGSPMGFVWTGDAYLVLWNSNATSPNDSTLAAIDSTGAIRWTHTIQGGAMGLAWDGHRAAVARIDSPSTTFTIESIDPATQVGTTVFETPSNGFTNLAVAGAHGRFGIAWTDMAGGHFCELVDGKAGPIATIPGGAAQASFIATPAGYAASSPEPHPAVVLFDRDFTQVRFDLASEPQPDFYGPMLAATADDVVAVRSTQTPMIVVDFVQAHQHVELPLQQQSGLIDAAVNAAVADGVVYLVANELSASAHYLGMFALTDAGFSLPNAVLTDPLLSGIPTLIKNTDRAAILIGHATVKPSFSVSQRCN